MYVISTWDHDWTDWDEYAITDTIWEMRQHLRKLYQMWDKCSLQLYHTNRRLTIYRHICDLDCKTCEGSGLVKVPDSGFSTVCECVTKTPRYRLATMFPDWDHLIKAPLEVHYDYLPGTTPSREAIRNWIFAASLDGDEHFEILHVDEFTDKAAKLLGDSYWALTCAIHEDFKLPYDQIGEAVSDAIYYATCSGYCEYDALFEKYKEKVPHAKRT